MNSQLLLAVSQSHQQELRQAAREARAVSQARTRTLGTLSRRFRMRTESRIRPTAPAISAEPRTA